MFTEESEILRYYDIKLFCDESHFETLKKKVLK